MININAYTLQKNADSSSEKNNLKYLKFFSTYKYNGETHNEKFIYDNKSIRIKKISKKLNLKEILGNGNDFEKILNLLKWSEKYLKFDGTQITDRRFDKYNFFKIIENAKKFRYRLNCRYTSLLFTQMLLSSGFKARWVKCIPLPLTSNETHCVTEVYINEYKKWIVVDPSYYLIYFDKKGIPLNLIEMRQNLINGNGFRFFTKEKDLHKYIYKQWQNHIFRFQYSLYNGFDMFSEKKQKFAILNPINFLSFDEINAQKSNKFIQYDNNDFFLKL